MNTAFEFLSQHIRQLQMLLFSLCTDFLNGLCCWFNKLRFIMGSLFSFRVSGMGLRISWLFDPWFLSKIIGDSLFWLSKSKTGSVWIDFTLGLISRFREYIRFIDSWPVWLRWDSLKTIWYLLGRFVGGASDAFPRLSADFVIDFARFWEVSLVIFPRIIQWKMILQLKILRFFEWRCDLKAFLLCFGFKIWK